jgi:hypothetical protein
MTQGLRGERAAARAIQLCKRFDPGISLMTVNTNSLAL